VLKPHATAKSGTRSSHKPGARALYLGARDKKHISCTDDALVVRNDRAQTLRYPVARIARVVSSTAVDWSGEALALCMRHSIGICWVDARGSALGTCYPHQRSHLNLTMAIDLWLEEPHGLAHYQNWLRARRMAVLVQWGQQSAENEVGLINPVTWENTKREWVYGQQFAEHLPPSLRSHCLAYTATQLHGHGTGPLLWGPDANTIDLENDLCQLLWAEMNLCTGSMADTALGDKEITALFERWTARHGVALAMHVSSLYRTAMKAIHP
jgi:hypothetical protein